VPADSSVEASSRRADMIAAVGTAQHVGIGSRLVGHSSRCHQGAEVIPTLIELDSCWGIPLG